MLWRGRNLFPLPGIEPELLGREVRRLVTISTATWSLYIYIYITARPLDLSGKAEPSQGTKRTGGRVGHTTLLYAERRNHTGNRTQISRIIQSEA